MITIGNDRYAPLPGNLPWRRTSLFVGDTQLLIVRNNSYQEDYRYVSLRDIQSLVMTRTAGGGLINVLLLAPALVIFMAALGMTGFALRFESLVGWSIAGAFIAAGVAVNTALGPTCKCTLGTTLQSIPLPSLVRVRAANRAFDMLVLHVEQVQGALRPEDVPSATASVSPTQAPAAMMQPPPMAIRHERGVFHLWLFLLLLAFAMVQALDLLWPQTAWTALAVLLVVLQVGALVGALIRQSGSDLPGNVRRATWAALVYLCLLYCGFIIERMADMSESGAGEVIGIAMIAISSVLSVAGLLMLLEAWRRYRNRRTAARSVAAQQAHAQSSQALVQLHEAMREAGDER